MMSKERIKEKDMKSVDDVQSALKDLFAETIRNGVLFWICEA